MAKHKKYPIIDLCEGCPRIIDSKKECNTFTNPADEWKRNRPNGCRCFGTEYKTYSDIHKELAERLGRC